MRYWMYVEPIKESSEPIYTILSDRGILTEYWDYWCERMRSAGKEAEINANDCILDWATIHWAQVVTPQLLQVFMMTKDEAFKEWHNKWKQENMRGDWFPQPSTYESFIAGFDAAQKDTQAPNEQNSES